LDQILNRISAGTVHLVDPAHLDSLPLGEFFVITVATHVFEIIGGSDHTDATLGTHEHRITGITAENVEGVCASECVYSAKFALPFVQSQCFEGFYEHIDI